MATLTLSNTSNFGSQSLRLLAKPFTAVFNLLISMAETNQRLRLASTLHEMSDEQLAAKGLKREDIVRYVFRDQMGF